LGSDLAVWREIFWTYLEFEQIGDNGWDVLYGYLIYCKSLWEDESLVMWWMYDLKTVARQLSTRSRSSPNFLDLCLLLLEQLSVMIYSRYVQHFVVILQTFRSVNWDRACQKGHYRELQNLVLSSISSLSTFGVFLPRFLWLWVHNTKTKSMYCTLPEFSLVAIALRYKFTFDMWVRGHSGV
jgi:hypothetical protein